MNGSLGGLWGQPENVGAQFVAGDRCKPFDLEHLVGGYSTPLTPIRDDAWVINAQSGRSLGDTTEGFNNTINRGKRLVHDANYHAM